MKKLTPFELFVKYMMLFIPLTLLFCGLYFAYYKMSLHNKITKTQEDIEFITHNINDAFQGTLKNFNTQTAATSGVLPFDIETKQTSVGYQIPNRFGGYMLFYEAVNTKVERTLYFSLYKDVKRYKEVYPGVGAYVILFTNLSKNECRALAQTDWSNRYATYMGMEASYVTPTSQYNGLYNLQVHILKDNRGEDFNTKDEGIVSRSWLNKDSAQMACKCKQRNCLFALKFS